MARLFTPIFTPVDGNGLAMAGAKLYFYVTGTTTPKDTYTSSTLGTPNANPVVADSNGLFGAIYMAQDVDYKMILKTSADVTVATRDPMLVINTSVIAHQGAIIVGNASGADSELTVSVTPGAALRSNGTTLAYFTPNYTKQAFLSGSGTYTTPANCTAIHVRWIGGGAGGGGSGGTTGPNGSAGGNSSFNSIVATGGAAGVGTTTSAPGAGGIGGTGGTGTASMRIGGGSGGDAGYAAGVNMGMGGAGGQGFHGGGAGSTGGSSASNGKAAATNSGAGGSGSISPGTTASAGGGGAGEYCELMILTPAATYAYAVGAGGAGGIGTGTNAGTGGAGAAGFVIVEEFYS